MKCPKCGTKNDPDGDFCEKCGHKLKEVRKITLGLILGWVLGVMFGMSGLTFIFEGSIKSGTALLLASLILLPPVNKFIKKEFNFELSKGVKIVAVIILFIIYAVSLEDGVFTPKYSAKTAEPVKYSPETTQPKTTTPVTQTPEPSAPKVEDKIYSMNQDIKVDYLTYRVTRAETFIEMGSSMFKKKTNGKFVKVYLEILNNAQETKQIFTPRFTIEDNQGRMYDRLSDDMMYIADYLELGKSLQPGLKTSGAIVFEMPTDSTNLKLIIKGDWLSTSQVKIAISDIHDMIQDTTLEEKQDAMMEEITNKCSSPFKCASIDACGEYGDIGRKNCPSGYVCCMV